MGPSFWVQTLKKPVLLDLTSKLKHRAATTWLICNQHQERKAPAQEGQPAGFSSRERPLSLLSRQQGEGPDQSRTQDQGAWAEAATPLGSHTGHCILVCS